MNEVLKKLLLILVVIPLFFLGCVATSKTHKITADHIEFPDYNFSIMKPPSSVN